MPRTDELADEHSLKYYADRDGMVYYTAIKRAFMARRQYTMLGRMIHAKNWRYTEAEWAIIKATPLPGCTGGGV